MVKRNAIVLSSQPKELVEGNKDLLKELVHSVVQQTLEAEVDFALGTAKGEHTGTRLDYRSGYDCRTLITRVDKLELRVAHDRQGRFRSKVFERYQRSVKTREGTSVGTGPDVSPGASTRKVK